MFGLLRAYETRGSASNVLYFAFPRPCFSRPSITILCLHRSKGTLLQGASCDDGSVEGTLEGGLISGHAYSINQVVEVKTPGEHQGEILVQLRNPWGGHEWTGRWCDGDPRWTDALETELGQRNVDDGMFWMCVDDFATSFNTITFADLVPEDYSVMRAEGEWTTKTAGGCANHKTWKNNPQFLMTVKKDKTKDFGNSRARVTIALNQPDSRMLFRNNELGKEDFDELYGNGTGYEESIGFTVWKVDGEPSRKTVFSAKGKVADADFCELRSVSTSFDCDPGTYLICPSTFDPKPMKWTMMIWCSHEIHCVDTNGGEDVQFYDAIDADILSEYESSSDPLPQQTSKIGTEAPLPILHINEIRAGSTPLIVKGDPGANKNVATLCPALAELGKCTWKCGTQLPEAWKNLQDYTMNSTNTFEKGEMVGVKRPDHHVRFAKVLQVNKDQTYDLCTGYVQDKGPLYKSNVPGSFILKFPHTLSPPSKTMLPTALMRQVGATFDCMDLNQNGTLDFGWSGDEGFTGEMAGDTGRRFLKENQISLDHMAETYQTMKETMDHDVDGIVDRAEVCAYLSCLSVTCMCSACQTRSMSSIGQKCSCYVQVVDWVSRRIITLSTKPLGTTLPMRIEEHDDERVAARKERLAAEARVRAEKLS